MTKGSATSTSGVEFEFVVGNNPEQLKGTTSRHVRSHAARLGWKAHHQTSSSSGSKRQEQKQRKRRQTTRSYKVTFECVEVEEVEESVDGRGAHGQQPRQQPWEEANPFAGAPPPPTFDWLLGGLRVDPFRSYPCRWRPFIPAVVDHYIVHMAQDIPELDQPGNRGLLRTKWFPLVMSEAATFQVVLLLAASNMVSVKGVAGAGCQILQLKADAINTITKSFVGDNDGGGSSNDSNNNNNKKEESQVSDAMVGAVAKMASFEAMHGNLESYHVHMQGLHRMVSVRGGLMTLGLEGLLRRIIVWIDLNSSFLLNIPRYFPGEMFSLEESEASDVEPEPNPARFTAA